MYLFYKEFHCQNSFKLVIKSNLVHFWNTAVVLSSINFQNLIAGSLFGSVFGLFLVCTLSSIGVSACYLLSKVCGVETFLMNYFPSVLTSSKTTVGNLVSKTSHFINNINFNLDDNFLHDAIVFRLKTTNTNFGTCY